MLEEVFENFLLLGVMFEVEAFFVVHWIICTKGVDQRYCHNNSKPKGTLQRVTNQSNCNCFIYLLQILSLRFVFHLHYHVHQILVYYNVLLTQPIDPDAWSINCPSHVCTL